MIPFKKLLDGDKAVITKEGHYSNGKWLLVPELIVPILKKKMYAIAKMNNTIGIAETKTLMSGDKAYLETSLAEKQLFPDTVVLHYDGVVDIFPKRKTKIAGKNHRLTVYGSPHRLRVSKQSKLATPGYRINPEEFNDGQWVYLDKNYYEYFVKVVPDLMFFATVTKYDDIKQLGHGISVNHVVITSSGEFAGLVMPKREP